MNDNQSNIFFATCLDMSIKRITMNMLFFNRKLHVHVKFACREKDLNSSAKILGQQQKNHRHPDLA